MDYAGEKTFSPFGRHGGGSFRPVDETLCSPMVWWLNRSYRGMRRDGRCMERPCGAVLGPWQPVVQPACTLVIQYRGYRLPGAAHPETGTDDGREGGSAIGTTCTLT